MDTIQLGDLTAELDRANAGTLKIHLSGRSSSREAGKTLAPLFDRVIAEASAESRVLALHFERLEYFNSSTIAALVQFIRAVHERGDPLHDRGAKDRRVPVRVREGELLRLFAGEVAEVLA